MKCASCLVALGLAVAFLDGVAARTRNKVLSTIQCTNPPYVKCGVCKATVRTNRGPRLRRTPTSENRNSNYYYSVGATVVYEVNATMTAYAGLMGNVTVTCQPDGTWSAPPDCDWFCSIAPAVVRASCSDGSRPDGSWNVSEQARCSCNAGFTRRSGNTRPICRNGNKWTQPLECMAERGRGRTRCANPPFVSCAICTTNDPKKVSRRRLLEVRPTANNRKEFFFYEVGKNVYYSVKPAVKNYTDLGGNITVTCLPSGEWSEKPTCEKFCSTSPPVVNATCQPPPRGADGHWSFKTKANCTCKAGHVRKTGSEEPTCRNNNTWTKSLICKVRPIIQYFCRRAPSIAYGRCLPTHSRAGKFRENDAVTCYCNSEYYINGTMTADNKYNTSARAFCNGAGNRKYRVRWRNIPTCARLPVTTISPVTCRTPHAVDNAGCRENCVNHTNKALKFNVGDSFKIFCNERYRLSGNPTITCQENGRWSRYPFCEPDDTPVTGCPMLTGLGYTCEAEKGVDPDLRIPRGYNITCQCDDSDIYKTVNGTDIDCLKNDQWSHRPSCEEIGTTETPGCYLADIQIDQNGQCVGTADHTAGFFTISEKVNCACNTNYYIEGQNTNITKVVITCDGTAWSAIKPKCVAIPAKQCNRMPEFDNGWCSAGGKLRFDEGDTISCECGGGYELTNPDHGSLTCIGAVDAAEQSLTDRVWDGIPKCRVSTRSNRRRCRSPVNSGYECRGGARQAFYSPGDDVYCRCRGARGSRTHFYCRRNGWNPSLGQCS